MSKNVNGNHNTPSLLNSSFYSSTSMNSVDHVKNFRNSLILRETSDQSLSWSPPSEGSVESEEEIDVTTGSSLQSARKGKETATIQMKNSPSLSALAGILNEKSRQAEQKVRLSSLLDASILKEEDEEELPQDVPPTSELDQGSSPNLIDMNDTNFVTYPNVPPTTYEQPDFLSTPRVHPRRNNNPFLQDFESSRSTTQEPFNVESSILEEPELERNAASTQPSSRNRRRSDSSILDQQDFDPRQRSDNTGQIESKRSSGREPSRARNTGQNTLVQQQLDSSQNQERVHMKARRRSTSTTLAQQHEDESNAAQTKHSKRHSRGGHPEPPEFGDVDKPQNADLGSQRQRSRRHSRASTLEKPDVNTRRTHHRSHTVDHSYFRAQGADFTDGKSVELEKEPSEDVVNGIPKRKNLRGSKNKSTNPSSTQRIVSAGSVLDQSSSNKRRSFFSLFKKKSSKESPKKSKQPDRKSQISVLSSSTFDSGSNEPSSPEKLTKKSHSTNTIFSTFRKNKDKEDAALLSSNTPPVRESQLDEISKDSSSFSSLKKEPQAENLFPSSNSYADKPKSTTLESDDWDMEDMHLQTPDLQSKSRSEVESAFEEEPPEEDYLKEGQVWQEEQKGDLPIDEPLLEATHFDDPLIKDLPKPMLPFLIKHDAGEALFPKSLDRHEVESIVSLERSRSVKSNRSPRRSLTDTLSVNAQNEGMFVTEASLVVFSTPDLSKSPTSSILRSGRFESISTPSNAADGTETTLLEKENSESIPKISLSPKRSPIASIEDNFDQLVLADDEDRGEGDVLSPKHVKTIESATGDDPGFTSEMMEFASLINFGEGLAFDLDLNSDIQSQKVQQESPKRLTNNINQNSLEQKFPSDSGLTIGASQKGRKSENQKDAHQNNVGYFSASTQDETEANIEESHQNYSSVIPDTELTDVIEQSTDIPNDLLEEIRSPSPQAFEHFHENEDEDIRRERHSFRDILASQTYIPEQHSDRPMSMSFKGLGRPSLNQNSAESGLFGLRDVNTESPNFDGPVDSSNRVTFSSEIVLYETYGLEEYDRRPELATCNMLTPQSAHMIKAELNQLKSEMEVHEASRCYTHFF